jgi:hypothetical protein
MNECGELPAEVLKANPSIETFDNVFAGVAKKSS